MNLSNTSSHTFGTMSTHCIPRLCMHTPMPPEVDPEAPPPPSIDPDPVPDDDPVGNPTRAPEGDPPVKPPPVRTAGSADAGFDDC